MLAAQRLGLLASIQYLQCGDARIEPLLESDRAVRLAWIGGGIPLAEGDQQLCQPCRPQGFKVLDIEGRFACDGLRPIQRRPVVSPTPPAVPGPAPAGLQLRPGWRGTRPPPAAAPSRRSWGWPVTSVVGYSTSVTWDPGLEWVCLTGCLATSKSVTSEPRLEELEGSKEAGEVTCGVFSLC